MRWFMAILSLCLLSEVTVPSVIILNTSNEQYFLPSEPVDTMEKLVNFINSVLDGTAPVRYTEHTHTQRLQWNNAPLTDEKYTHMVSNNAIWFHTGLMFLVLTVVIELFNCDLLCVFFLFSLPPPQNVLESKILCTKPHFLQKKGSSVPDLSQGYFYLAKQSWPGSWADRWPCS